MRVRKREEAWVNGGSNYDSLNLGEKWTEPGSSLHAIGQMDSGKHSVQVDIGELDQIVWETLPGVGYRSRVETLGAHLSRKAEGMVIIPTLGAISSQSPEDASPRGRFRDRTVGR